MFSASAAQWAIRAGANGVGTDLASGIEHATDIKNTAEKRVGDLIKGSSNASKMQGKMAAEVALVAVALEGLQMAYTGVTAQMAEVGNQRLAFMKERETGTATFVVPINKEIRDLYKEEVFIKYFVELTTKKSSFSTYSGHHSALFPDGKGSYFYSVLPFYRMSEGLGHPVENKRPIDKQRRAISLFLKSTVPDFLAHIDRSFQTEWRVTSFFSSTYQGANYMNNLRAARFVVMSLANLLWNIQHPVDPETGFPLCLTSCIKLCRDVAQYLDILLDSAEKDRPPYLKHLSHDRDRLISFVRKIDMYTHALRAAYTEEQLHQVNINEVTNSAHQALEIMDKNVFNLIYKRRHPITNEPDDSAADSLVCMFGYLRDLFMRNPGLIGFFSTFKKLNPEKTHVNETATTVIDAVIMFCHLPKPERLTLIKDLKKSTLSSVLEFAETLNQLHYDFIAPVDRVSKRDLKATASYTDRAKLSAKRLIPFITLVLDDYGVEVDTPHIQARIQDSETNAASWQIMSGKEQINAINQDAALDGAEGYYQWTLSPFIDVNVQTAEALNGLVKRQHRLTQVTKLLDAIRELIQDYQTFLQLKSFQKFLLNCLSKAKDEYAALELQIDQMDAGLAEDERMPRRLKQILCQMTNEMDSRLDEFSQATAQFKRIVGAPGFPDQEKHMLAFKIHQINDQFISLFGEPSGLNNISPMVSEETSRSPIPNTRRAFSTSRFSSAVRAITAQQRLSTSFEPGAALVPEIELNPVVNHMASNQVVALSQLAHRCFDGLSYLSQIGYKGVLLRNLIAKIDRQSDFSEAQFNRAIKELVCVTASYRETYFFQAAYGQTRSAKILIKAIRDPALQAILPLGSIIFNTTDIDYSTQSDAQIIHALENLRSGERWQESAGRLTMVSAL